MEYGEINFYLYLHNYINYEARKIANKSYKYEEVMFSSTGLVGFVKLLYRTIFQHISNGLPERDKEKMIGGRKNIYAYLLQAQ